MTPLLKKSLKALQLGFVIISAWLICMVIYAALMALIHVSTAQAASLKSASTVRIHNQDQIRVQWSTKNVNTLTVSHETIDQVIGNSNQYRAKRDTTGQIYITLLNTNEPFSIFFRTSKGHHFSVVVEPCDTLNSGVTTLVRFQLKNSHTYNFTKSKKTNLPLSARTIMTDFTTGCVPSSAVVLPAISTKPIQLTKTVRLQPERTWKVGSRIVRVFILQNYGRKPFYFEAKQFHDKGVIAIKPQQNPVPAKSATWLFEIVKG